MALSVQRVGALVVGTNARCLIEAARQIPQPRHICLEDGTLSEWLYEVLSPCAEMVMVAAVGESRGPKEPKGCLRVGGASSWGRSGGRCRRSGASSGPEFRLV